MSSSCPYFDISIFESLTLLYRPRGALLHSPSEEGIPLGSFTIKVSKVLAASAWIIGLSYAVANRKIYNTVEVLYLLCQGNR